ncbi:MAG: type II toxin-antitoxin system PemK/MazF family toxin [Candidatus Hydrogenedentes bacterium]|nr:type II toxin-antitoxin system PemK/MazF family toxin [Candidatus Hydrogenedentota bacterium]
MDVVVRRFDVFLIALEPTIGSEINKSRPCLIVSPDEMNKHLATIIVAPMTTAPRNYPTRIPCRFKNTSGRVALDQLRTIDKSRLIRKLGTIAPDTQRRVLDALAEMFTE